jgi:hypothetical protein
MLVRGFEVSGASDPRRGGRAVPSPGVVQPVAAAALAAAAAFRKARRDGFEYFMDNLRQWRARIGETVRIRLSNP